MEAIILELLGDWYVKVGQNQEAAVYYQKCLAIYEKSGETAHPNSIR